jgi:thioredoxin-dependent peroxiredoxin
MLISPNVPAPDFTLLDETGHERKLSEYFGKPIILYFYPEDDTPGCTTEACSFRDNYSTFQKAGVTILGVSPDSPKSHAKFKEKYHLPFTLLADEGHKICDLYGVWGKKVKNEREYYGVIRTTYLIDPKGMIKKVFEHVKPSEHSAEILAELQVA